MSTNELNINDLLTHIQANGWNINDFQKYLEDNEWNINDLQKHLDVLLEYFQAYNWDINDLQIHLQAAVDLEFWTIPFYMSAMYSIKDQSCEAYRLIQSVVNQEMLHLQLAANIANAYGCSPKIRVLPYEGTKIPHLNFKLDIPDPRTEFSPYSAAIGPLDEERINSMCLIEYPESKTGHIPNLKSDITEYGSIGEFYDALEVGIIIELIKEGHPTYGGCNQISVFEPFYQNFTQQTITENGEEGVKQAHNIINAIRDQGEGGKSDKIPTKYRNTADGFDPDLPHFKKFIKIREEMELPETYYGEANPDHESGKEAQRILIHHFRSFMDTLETMFSTGEMPDNFGSQMATIGGNILHCWQEGAIPKFYEETPTSKSILILKSLICIEEQEWTGDELYFKITIDGNEPVSYPLNKLDELDMVIEYNHKVVIELMEDDYEYVGDRDDSLGKITFTSCDTSGQKHFDENGGHYVLEFDIKAGNADS